MTATPELRGALVVRPGDTLIVRHKGLTMDQAAEIKRLLVAKLPDLADILVISADEIAVYRPDPTP